jgi:hypothetical protein
MPTASLLSVSEACVFSRHSSGAFAAGAILDADRIRTPSGQFADDFAPGKPYACRRHEFQLEIPVPGVSGSRIDLTFEMHGFTKETNHAPLRRESIAPEHDRDRRLQSSAECYRNDVAGRSETNEGELK